MMTVKPQGPLIIISQIILLQILYCCSGLTFANFAAVAIGSKISSKNFFNDTQTDYSSVEGIIFGIARLANGAFRYVSRMYNLKLNEIVFYGSSWLLEDTN